MATLEPTIERRQHVGGPLLRVSWGAIFAGAAISTGLALLLGLLGLAVGASVIDAASGDSPSPQAFGVGAGTWWVVTGVVSLFVGGWATGRLAGLRRRGEGPLHGLVTWAVASAALVFLMSSAVGAIASGALRVVTAGARLVGPDEVGDRMLGPGWRDGRHHRWRGARSPADDEPARAAAPAGDRTGRDADIAARPDQESVRAAADDAAHGLAIAAWWTFAYLLLTAIAAMAGGIAGAPRSHGVASSPPLRSDVRSPLGGV